MNQIDELVDILKRDAINIYSIEELRKLLNCGKKLIIKLGADPSRPDLHLGHTVVLNKLRLFQEMGHEVYFVIGDFTAMIGDPTGKSVTRPALTIEQTRKSGETYYKQVTKILDPKKTHVVYNSEWLNKLNFSDVIKLAGQYTLAQIMERDDFSNRYKKGTPIGLHEILYPLMQGYDSVHLHSDIEIGGTDQTFNLLVGRDLQNAYGQTEQVVITFPLLPGLDGVNKMSKSLDNYIGIDEPPTIMFEKCMKVPDELLKMYFSLTTDIPEDTYLNYIENDIRQAHLFYAEFIVTKYHSSEDAKSAKAYYEDVAKGKLPDGIETVVLKGQFNIVDAMVNINYAKSKSEARRLIDGNAITLNEQKVSNYDTILDEGNDYILKKGKSKFIKIIVVNK